MKLYREITDWKKEALQYPLILIFGGLFQELLVEGLLSNDFDFSWVDAMRNGFFWLFMWKGSEYMVVLMDRSGIKWDEQPLLRFVLTLFATLLYVILAVYFLYIMFFVVFGNMSLFNLLSEISFSNFKFTIIITLSIGTVMHGRGFLIEWRQAAIEVEKFKNESLKSQYESLKNQVNPHFLFNSLNVLSSLVYDDQEKAVQFIRKLSQVYRYVLDKKDQEIVTIDDELDFLKNYVFLQKLRFGDNLIVDIQKGDFNGMIPPLGLQLLVENAIKHNIVSEAKPLKIQVNIDTHNYSISNNIQEKLSKDSTGIGLNNLKARYEFLVKKEVEIINDGVTFKVILPSIEADKIDK